MPLLDFWATDEGTVVAKTATTVTLTLAPSARILAMNPGIEVPVARGVFPWNNQNQTTRNNATYAAAYQWINDFILGPWGIPSGDLWDYRCQYARMQDEIVKYTAYRATLPPAERGKVDTKLGNFQRYLSEYKALAGE